MFMNFNDVNNFMVFGPKAHGAHGTLIFLEICFMVWDLSRSVPKVFRSPGNTSIHLLLFTLKFNMSLFKGHLLLYCLLNLPIELPLDPRLRQQTGPRPDRLGLKCYLAWGAKRK